MNTYLLYHGGCPDGFGAAWVFWKKFGNEITYKPVKYGDLPPEFEKDSKIFMVDFSYSRDILLSMKKKYTDILLIDHHVSAQKDLEGLEFAYFDIKKSGAVLAWKHLFPDRKIPLLLEYVQDRDLWRFELSKSKEINNVISITKDDFLAWDDISYRIENEFDDVVKIGEAIEKIINKFVRINVSNASVVKFDGYEVPCVNTTNLHSETGHELLQKFSQSPFSMVWFRDDKGKFQVSFRSRGDFDVSCLAKKFGGGGHRSASGCVMKSLPY